MRRHSERSEESLESLQQIPHFVRNDGVVFQGIAGQARNDAPKKNQGNQKNHINQSSDKKLK